MEKQVTIEVIKPFRFAYRGCDVVEYATGEHAVSERCAEVAIAEGWAKAKGSAPENKDAGKAPRNKAR